LGVVASDIGGRLLSPFDALRATTCKLERSSEFFFDRSFLSNRLFLLVIRREKCAVLKHTSGRSDVVVFFLLVEM
jgi:hypothetical protein